MKNYSIGQKQIGGILNLALILLIAGSLGIIEIKTLKDKTVKISQISPLIDAAIEMNYHMFC